MCYINSFIEKSVIVLATFVIRFAPSKLLTMNLTSLQCLPYTYLLHEIPRC